MARYQRFYTACRDLQAGATPGARVRDGGVAGGRGLPLAPASVQIPTASDDIAPLVGI
jgi:hypothetical protein